MFVFCFIASATPEIYTLSLHDALPIFELVAARNDALFGPVDVKVVNGGEEMTGEDALAQVVVVDRNVHRSFSVAIDDPRSEEHTSELQSRLHLVCRLLLEKKKKFELPH